MAIQIKIRRDTKAEWDSADPVLLAGELGFELKDSATSGRFKIGNGSREWSRLPFWYAYQDSAGAYGGAAAAWYGDRALSAGGTTSIDLQSIDYFDITTTGNASDFGDLALTNHSMGCSGASNSTYGVFGGGRENGGSTYVNRIQYVTVSTLSNTSDFGDMTETYGYSSAVSDGTYGLWGGGWNGGYIQGIDYITIASPGNASNFGNLSSATYSTMAAGDATYGLFAGGVNTGGLLNVIEYVTMATPSTPLILVILL